MTKLLVVAFCVFFCQCVQSASYNQRQTGELNVQLELNDVQIFALMKGKDDYVDYDYAYDYSEMTIKPSGGTTRKPLNKTSTLALVVNDNVTTISSLHEPSKASTTEGLVSTITVDTVSDSSPITETVNKQNMTSPTTTPSICRQGFVKNDKGLCEFKYENASNALMQMVRLSQKLKRREN